MLGLINAAVRVNRLNNGRGKQCGFIIDTTTIAATTATITTIIAISQEFI